MNTIVYRVSFETVSAISRPELYLDERPRYTPESIPEDTWHRIEVELENIDDVRRRIAGFDELRTDGEYIRGVEVIQVTRIEMTRTMDLSELGA